MSIESIKPGISKAEVFKLVGEPIEITELDENEILVYQNADTGLNHFIYLQQDNVVLISRDVFGKKFSIRGIVDPQHLSQAQVFELEFPSQVSVKKDYLFLWTDSGFGLIADDNNTESLVTKTFLFSAKSKEEFFDTWTQSKYITNQVGFIQNENQSGQLVDPSASRNQLTESRILVIGLAVIVLTVLIFSALAFTMKKRKKIKKLAHTLEKK